MSGDLSIAFAPALPWAVIGALALVALALLALHARARAPGLMWRAIACVGLLAALANPMAVIEERRELPDVALLVVDESKSQSIGERRAATDAAVQRVREQAAGAKDLELRVIRSGAGGGVDSDGTRLFGAIERALGDVPRSRLAGVVLVTDGQVHDAPKAEALAAQSWPAPVHALLTGQRGERDRRLVIEQAPSYAIVGKPQQMTIRVDDGPGAPGATVRVELRRDAGEPQTLRLQTGVPQTVDFTLERAGTTLFEIAVEPGPRELTLENNRAVVAVGGVRDRLRVLLVTGEPHAGERTWRALLKSDPSVDLVHFTILRPPEAQDFTPVNELSLIAFPIRELFEVKLAEFDLIIFDRYRRRDVLAQIYLDNIVRWVRAGGALFIAVGPSGGAPTSLFNSPLGAIMPGGPSATAFEQPFKPILTETGRRHPVTADLPGAGAENGAPQWGNWFRHLDTEARRGHTLMSGVNARPLLIMDRVGEGRVAQLQSDHIWLWGRGYDGGGPPAELLRRVAHWLMKEPDLEEEALRATSVGGRIEVTRRTLAATFPQVTMTAPDGSTKTIDLRQTSPGLGLGVIDVDKPGLYRFDDGTLRTVAAVGSPDPLEFSDVRATDAKLKPLTEASGGSIMWLADTSDPDIRSVRPGRAAGGSDWIGLRRNEGYTVAGINQLPLLPGILVAMAFLLALGSAWWREGR